MSYCRCGEMADAQDLKSWGRKKPCGFESHHRHQLQVAVLQFLTLVWQASASESASEIKTHGVLNSNSAIARQPPAKDRIRSLSGVADTPSAACISGQVEFLEVTYGAFEMVVAIWLWSRASALIVFLLQ